MYRHSEKRLGPIACRPNSVTDSRFHQESEYELYTCSISFERKFNALSNDIQEAMSIIDL